MRSTVWLAAAGLAATLAGAGCGERSRAPERRVAASTPGPRISMAELHMAGGVPPRWSLTPPPGDAAAGRAAFEELGCHSCHAVEGERFAQPTTAGPELTGMGTHHPLAYFVESILNPDAVLVDGPGYIGPDGRSSMPAYPDMTLATLADVVAYLQSLTEGGRHFVDHAAMGHGLVPGAPPPELPAAPAEEATSFLVQIYDVKEGQLAAFQEWFQREGAAQFLAGDGVLNVETWVDVTRKGPPLVTVIGFRDDAARTRFLGDHANDKLAGAFDGFIGPHPHQVYRRRPLYRAPTLSTDRRG